MDQRELIAKLVEALKEIKRVSGTSCEHWHIADKALKLYSDQGRSEANGSRDCGACATEESRKYNDKNREAKNARRRVRRANGKAN